jgi:SAM-dependent methyltransferase
MEKSDLASIRAKIARMGHAYAPGNASRVGHLYSPLPFPEFKDIPSQREAVYERFNLIEPHVFGERLLDIGCHTGFNCFEFEKMGFKCVGIESHKLTTEIAQDVAAYYDSECEFINAYATPNLINDLGKFDVCLFLSTFQWITQAEGFDYAVDVLEAALLNSKVLFFETSMGNEGKYKMVKLPNADAVESMLKALGTKVTNLGEVVAPGGQNHPRRVIFKCES